MSSLYEDTVHVNSAAAVCESVRPLDLARVGQREATPKRLRRARIHFSPAARRELQAAFCKNQYPDYKDRSRVAALVGVGEPRVQTWFQNKRSRVLRQLRQDDRSGKTSGEEADGKRNKTDAPVPTSRNIKHLRIDTNGPTTFESQYMYSEKMYSPSVQHQQQLYPGFHLPMSPVFALPSIQSHLPLSPSRSGRLVVPPSSWADCFLYPPSNVFLQHHLVDAVPAWAAYEDPFRHLMLCLPLANRDSIAFSNAVPEPASLDIAEFWRQDLAGCSSGHATL